METIIQTMSEHFMHCCTPFTVPQKPGLRSIYRQHIQDST